MAKIVPDKAQSDDHADALVRFATRPRYLNKESKMKNDEITNPMCLS